MKTFTQNFDAHHKPDKFLFVICDSDNDFKIDARDERLQKERYRMQLEEDIDKRRQVESDTQDPDELAHHVKAQAYANEQEEQKVVEMINARRDAEFNQQQAEARKRQTKEEENKVEWWESRSGRTSAKNIYVGGNVYQR